LIDIQRVSFTYPSQAGHGAAVAAAPALRDVSLRIGPGEYLALLGHNGSGKSTLARLCNALLRPTTGQVLVQGHQIIATGVGDDVAWGLAARGWPADLIRERVGWALAAAGIADLRDRAPHRLSGGQRQRLAIAGILALRPAVLIADEATAMLDPLSRAELVALLRRLNRAHGLTIIHVTHLLEEAAVADRVVALERGQVALDGPPAAVFADLARLRRLQLAVPAPIELAARLRAAGLAIDPAALTVESIAAEIARLR
jgi:energy-coupling factor transport system ATP-binding protein